MDSRHVLQGMFYLHLIYDQLVNLSISKVTWLSHLPTLKPWGITYWLGKKLYRLVVSNFLNVHPYLGKWSNLTNMFRMGWNHHLVYFLFDYPTVMAEYLKSLRGSHHFGYLGLPTAGWRSKRRFPPLQIRSGEVTVSDLFGDGKFLSDPPKGWKGDLGDKRI